jgi:phosphoglucan,water dikinase
MNEVIDALHALTTVRALLADNLAAGLRNDAPDSALSMRQKFRLAEIRCEEYAFVLLSRVGNLLEAQVRRWFECI